MSSAATIEGLIDITLNGEPHAIPAGLSIAGLLRHLGLDPRKVALERNLAIVPRSIYETVRVEVGDRIEIVHFIGGGR